VINPPISTPDTRFGLSWLPLKESSLAHKSIVSCYLVPTCLCVPSRGGCGAASAWGPRRSCGSFTAAAFIHCLFEQGAETSWSLQRPTLPAILKVQLQTDYSQYPTRRCQARLVPPVGHLVPDRRKGHGGECRTPPWLLSSTESTLGRERSVHFRGMGPKVGQHIRKRGGQCGLGTVEPTANAE
jgi:hypothetical protein